MKHTFIKTIFLLNISMIPLCLQADIDTQIDAIRNAPLSKRFKLMNAFKQEIIEMKEKERIHAITQLKSITKSKYGDRALHEMKTHINIHHTQKKNTHNSSNDIENEVTNEIEHKVEDHVEDSIEDQAQSGDNNDD